MAQNKEIVKEIKICTENVLAQRKFLFELFQWECSKKNGWYEKQYDALLKKYYEDDEK